MSDESRDRAKALAPILETLRAKLLDLSTRNRLLAFRHGTVSCLRVADELPDQLYRGLMEGQGFTFDAVPEPSQRELESYHAADQAAPRATAPEGALPRPKAETWAQHCGIEVDYELPLDAAEERPRRHSDRKIQTLLYPDGLDRRLRKLRTDARTAIEETGSNLLHLAIGFLEWRDTRNPRQGYLAPLLLVPVELERLAGRGGKHSYRLSWTGEDLQPNLSLEKKLADDFALTLPAFDEEMQPEDYFKQVRRALADQAGWRVRRYATLALFQFGKQLLYRDLDPAVWPKERGLAESGLVQRLLLGESGGGPGLSAAPEPRPDDIDLGLELVERSDSSQSAALLRVLGGESLVIQGPPGTGKSQSITNLIAAALGRGKRVLFVSEKLAALEVVRRRLDEVGLGDFVLELHSHKTRKQALVEDLRHRLTAGERYRPPRRIALARRALANNRQPLQDYAAIVAQPFGALALPISDILFQAGRLRRRLGVLAREAPVAADLDAMALTSEAHKTAKDALATFAALASRFDGPLAEHPWAGVSSHAVLGEADRHAALAQAGRWRDALLQLEERLHPLRERLGLDKGCDLSPLTLLAPCRQEIAQVRLSLEGAADTARQILDYLSIGSEDRLQTLREAAAALRLAVSAPPGLDRLPQEILRDPSLEADLAGLRAQLDELLNRRDALRPRLVLDPEALGEAAELRLLARDLGQGGFLGWLRASHRAARRDARALCTAGEKASRQADTLRRAAAFLEDRQRLIGVAAALGLSGDGLAALRHGLDRLLAARAWTAEVEDAFGRGPAPRAAAGRQLTQAGAARLADLAALAAQAEGATLLALEPALSSIEAGTDPWRGYLADLLPGALAEAVAALPHADFEALLERLDDLLSAVAAAAEEEARFSRETGLDRGLWDRPDLLPRARLEVALNDAERLAEWLEAERLLSRAEAPGVKALMSAVMEGRLPPDAAVETYEHLVFDALAKAAFAAHPLLARMRDGEQDSLRAAFRDGDEALMELTAQEIAAELARAPTPEGRGGARVADFTDLRLVRRETGKQKRHIPIRQLVRRAGGALQAMKPCFMMGPQSVAQYLEPGALTFDLLVFDEASQVRPEEAVGALARAEQVVIVGDSNQLPPTSFFQRTGEVVPEEEADLASATDSILEMAENRLPSALLRWHYRSRHPDLIAFSNQRFYASRLLLFPSPRATDADQGLCLRPVAQGVCQSGRNPAEAEAVAEAAIRHLVEEPGQSLGVVAMNVEQRDLIQQLVDRKAEGEAALAGGTEEARGGGEPFFVKNLENVQGDERDVIFISMTYGPPEAGARVPQYFGPINQESGWRRLNVLFTRAKERMEVFSSLRACDVTPGESSARGPHELQGFLRFAEGGLLDDAPRPSGRHPDSDFEVAVIEGLEQRGYSCCPQVGQAGFFIDIGVLDPETPGRFLAGIECDGANYHSSRSARDRDHLRQAVLEQLGWTIFRVWSTDWFLDPDRSLIRLIGQLEAARAARHRQPPPAPKSQPALPGLEGPGDGLPSFEPLPEVLSAGDARARLVRLREAIYQANPERDRAKGLLRRSMLEELLRKRPLNEAEFLAQVRSDLRAATQGDDLKTYGPRIFDILERIA